MFRFTEKLLTTTTKVVYEPASDQGDVETKPMVPALKPLHYNSEEIPVDEKISKEREIFLAIQSFNVLREWMIELIFPLFCQITEIYGFQPTHVLHKWRAHPC